MRLSGLKAALEFHQTWKASLTGLKAHLSVPSTAPLRTGFFRKREVKKEMSLSSQWVVVVNPFLICLFENEGTEEPWRM